MKRCVNCGNNSRNYLCANCKKIDVLESVFQEIRTFDPEESSNQALLEIASQSNNKYAARDIIPEMLALFDETEVEYYYCFYYGMKRAPEIEERGEKYISEHAIEDIKTQRILYYLLDYYIPREFIKPKHWFELIKETTGLCAELYLFSAKYFAMIGEYDDSDAMIKKSLEVFNGTGFCMFRSPEYMLKCIDEQKEKTNRYRNFKHYIPNSFEARSQIDKFLEKKNNENVERKLSVWKKELLDTGKRNKMINFRETQRTTLRILEPETTELFNKLAFSDKALTFQKPISKNTDIRTSSMIALLETLSCSLDVRVGDIKATGTIVEQEKTLKNLRAKAKLAQEEQGTNILYLCFGFIEWREHNSEESPWLRAPLLMMPVSLNIQSFNAPYTLSRYDDDIDVNPTLSYRFSTEYNIELPSFEAKNRESINDYFVEIEKIVDRQGWKIVKDVYLGLFSFLKITMYHDLNNNRELILRNPVLKAMIGDRTAIGPLPEKVKNFDFDSQKPGNCYEVVDSDSSQDEAILLSKLGVSFVVQGPPGTGKSQTITNIISEALADGKKVLFVSEKAAALQVVLKRLTEVGLSDFCLSLHDYKANKKEIVDGIGANLSLQKDYVDRSASKELTELMHDRQFLNSYVEDLHRVIEPLDQSVYMAFGRLSKLEKATTVEFSLEKIDAISKEQYASILYCLSAYEKALHNMNGKLSENPWRDTVAISSSQQYKARLLEETKDLSQLLCDIADMHNRLASKLNVEYPQTFNGAGVLLDLYQTLHNVPKCVTRNWFDTRHIKKGREMVINAKEHANNLQKHRNAIFNEWDSVVLSINPIRIQEAYSSEYSWIYDETSELSVAERLAEQKAIATKMKTRICELLDSYHHGLRLLAYEQPDTIDNVLMVGGILKRIANAPRMEASWLDLRNNTESLSLIEKAIDHSNTYKSIKEEILRDWEPSVYDIDAEGMLLRFKTEYVGLLHTLKSNYRQDIKILRINSKAVGEKLEESAIIALLQKMKELKAEQVWFDSNSEALKCISGSQYEGINTDWTQMRDKMCEVAEITKLFPYSVITETGISAIMEINGSSQLSGEAMHLADELSVEKMDQLESDITNWRFDVFYSRQGDLNENVIPLLDMFLEKCSVQESYAAMFTSSKLDSCLKYKDINNLLSNVLEVKNEELWFDEEDASLRNLFEESYSRDKSDWDSISYGLDVADKLMAMFDGKVPDLIIDIACGDMIFDSNSLNDIIELERLVDATKPRLISFSDQFSGDDLFDQELSVVANRYDDCMARFDNLNNWIVYAETRKECDKVGLEGFTTVIAELDNTVPDVKDAFEKGFYRKWVELQLNDESYVRGFQKWNHEQRASRFIDLDKKQYSIARDKIRENIISRYPDLDEFSRGGSELSILRHEMEKKRRIMPLRKLFHSIPSLLLTLKPCLMMSPLSVAYFLEAELYHFDMVIFDEASQIFPQDAIGAIFRAKQVIIAGDTKQLPPTNFFATSTSNESDVYDDDGNYEDNVYDSILEETANILPTRTLLWHYRSKHEHLIAFSNQEIYRNELITFPSSNEREPDTGVEFEYVENGYYEPSPKSYNILEARRIVELVKEHIDKHPKRSLGVIAFSEKQQQAISLELQRFREKNPKYESFFAEGKEDEFFVKNLENVQGDERDTIFFSIGYAKTQEQIAKGKTMSLRFGPLSNTGGERRLNVAITRAKINVKLVSSILPSDIDLSRTSSEGVHMLRSYIEFARNGEASLASGYKINRTDEFADSVAAYLMGNGFEVKQYVGCSGYKIDIAVKHPDSTVEQFIAGIECDGFSYASARTARDRDRLRGTVLRSMGWNLYRVWSAEWYKNPEIEGQKLLDFIRATIERSNETANAVEPDNDFREESARIVATTSDVEPDQAEKSDKVESNSEEDILLQKKIDIDEQPVRSVDLNLRWVEMGSEVFHKRYGEGVVERINRTSIYVRFDQGVKVFRYPNVFDEGVLSKAETSRQQSDVETYEWAALGATIFHGKFGQGIIKSIDDQYIVVDFNGMNMTFKYPSALENGCLSKRAGNVNIPVKHSELMDRRRKVFFDYLCSDDYAEPTANSMTSAVSRVGTYAVENGFSNRHLFELQDYVEVRNLWEKLESDQEFNAFNRNQNRRFSLAMKHYLEYAESALNRIPETPVVYKTSNNQNSLMEVLRMNGFKCIDNRNSSSILWVIYDNQKNDLFEKIILGYDVQFKLEKRGALATGNIPAWRIMYN